MSRYVTHCETFLCYNHLLFLAACRSPPQHGPFWRCLPLLWLAIVCSWTKKPLLMLELEPPPLSLYHEQTSQGPCGRADGCGEGRRKIIDTRICQRGRCVTLLLPDQFVVYGNVRGSFQYGADIDLLLETSISLIWGSLHQFSLKIVPGQYLKL